MAAELAKLEKDTIAKFQSTTDDALWKDDSKSKLSVPETNEKVAKLTAILKENIKLSQVEVSEDLLNARSSVISCLKENKGQSLNCWEEVEVFRKLVKEL